EVEQHENELEALMEKLRDAEEQVRNMPRTRGNVGAYKRVIDRRNAVRAEIARTRSAGPTEAGITSQMLDFYAQREQRNQKKRKRDALTGEMLGALAQASSAVIAETLGTSASGGTAADADDRGKMAIQ